MRSHSHSRWFTILLCVTLCLSLHAQNENVGIGTPSPDPSARLEIQSNDQGVLIPRMDSLQRTMINAPATGLLVYQTDGQAGFWFYDGSAWFSLSGGQSGTFQKITDGDDDTKVQVDEGGMNDNTIRFDVAGDEVMTIDTIVRMKDSIQQMLIGITLPDGQSRIQSQSDLSNGRAVTGTVTGSSGIGIYGTATNTSATFNYGGQFNANGSQGVGVSGLSLGIMGRGVYGIASHASAITNYGGYFWANGFEGRGVYAEATGPDATAVYGTATSGSSLTNYGGYFLASGFAGRGVYAEVIGTEAVAVYGNANNASGTVNYGGYFTSNGSTGIGAYGHATGENGTGIRGFVSGDDGDGVWGTAIGNTGSGIRGQFNNSSSLFGSGGRFSSNANFGRGVFATAFGPNGIAVYGVANNDTTTENNYGGYFESNGTSGIAVSGYATDTSYVSVGGSFRSQGALGIGVRGIAHASDGYAVYGISNNGWAGLFSGKVHVGGTLTVGNFSNVFESEGSNLLSFRGTFLPFFDASYDLGSSDKRWKDIYASNDVIQTSDARLKKDVREVPYGLAEILALRPVIYRWKDANDDQLKLGLLAQEVGRILPEVVHGLNDPDSEAMLGIKYAELVPVLIRAIQDLEAQMRELMAARKQP